MDQNIKNKNCNILASDIGYYLDIFIYSIFTSFITTLVNSKTEVNYKKLGDTV